MTDRITEVLHELERLAKEATPGPWECPELRGYASNFVYKAGGMRRQICRTVAQASNDGRFIAAMHPQRAMELIELAKAVIAEREASRRFGSAIGNPEAASGARDVLLAANNLVNAALEKIGGTPG